MALECQTFELTPLDVAEQREQVKLLSKLLGKLDSPKREVFVLVELEEVTAPEIASLLGVPVSTYSRLRVARQAFNGRSLVTTRKEKVGHVAPESRSRGARRRGQAGVSAERR